MFSGVSLVTTKYCKGFGHSRSGVFIVEAVDEVGENTSQCRDTLGGRFEYLQLFSSTAELSGFLE
jgi:hypothetical protein